jgi:hypothetical protein
MVSKEVVLFAGILVTRTLNDRDLISDKNKSGREEKTKRGD